MSPGVQTPPPVLVDEVTLVDVEVVPIPPMPPVPVEVDEVAPPAPPVPPEPPVDALELVVLVVLVDELVELVDDVVLVDELVPDDEVVCSPLVEALVASDPPDPHPRGARITKLDRTARAPALFECNMVSPGALDGWATRASLRHKSAPRRSRKANCQAV